MSHRVLLCGAGGQLGQELLFTRPRHWECFARDRTALDIADPNQIASALEETGAHWVINAAAFTAVDAAETDREGAWQGNAVGPGQLAEACYTRGVRLLHISTDFVFDGEQGRPYGPDDVPNPLGVYGHSKLEGERAVLATGGDPLVIRTGWVYSRHGGNFVKTMLRLMAERDALSVVEDQVGTPTWARGLAEACWDLIECKAASGIYHWSDAGVCSWYDFALAIAELAQEQGLLDRSAEITPISSRDYPTPAQRPAYSVLDKSRIRQLLGRPSRHWRTQLGAMLSDLKNKETSN